MIGDHPTVGQIYIFLKLDRDHFRISLDNHASQPVPNPLAILIFMITIHLHPITYVIGLILVRC